MTISEKRIEVNLPDHAIGIKFDETKFYQKSFNSLPRSKGVDIIVDEVSQLVLIELKDCSGKESENRWRVGCNDSKRNQAPSGYDISGRNSFDIEVAEKVAMTIACLVGVYTYGESKPQCGELLPFAKAFQDRRIPTQKKPILVCLLLEGSFGSQTRSDKTIRKTIQDSIKKKLQWLNCQVIVSASTDFRLYACHQLQ